jgi:hypothetical protein
MTCIKVLRPTEKYCYLDTASTAFPPSPSSPSPSYDSRRPDKNSSGSGIRRSSSSTSHTGSNDTLTLQSVGKSTSKDRDRDKEQERDREKDKDKEGRGSKYVSCVTILIDKLLSVFERVRYLTSTKLCACEHNPFSYFSLCLLTHLLSYIHSTTFHFNTLLIVTKQCLLRSVYPSLLSSSLLNPYLYLLTLPYFFSSPLPYSSSSYFQ